MSKLSEYLSEIETIFDRGNNMFENHEAIKPILQKMAADINVLYEIIVKNLSNPIFLDRLRHYSTLALDIFENPNYTFVVNIFPCLPNKSTDTSFQSVHHHGNLLLSTVAAFGPGYSAITFKPDYIIDAVSKETKMCIDKQYVNSLGNYDFVPNNTPHVVFYPSDVSATYALWSKKEKLTAGFSDLKKSPLIQKFKKPLQKIINLFGLKKAFGINTSEYLDFYPEAGKLFAMKERTHYPSDKGTNDNFLQNIFNFIQSTKFNDAAFLEKLLSSPSTKPILKEIITKLQKGETIEPVFVDDYINVPKVNLNLKDILDATK
jgi:hypothetical protein